MRRLTTTLVLGALALAACGGGSGPGRPGGGDGSGSGPRPATLPEVQGATHLSPLAGRRVVVTGVVTAVGRDGFYLQDPSGDGAPATSDALFVATGARPASSPGDSVRVSGTVREFVPGGDETKNLSVTRLDASSQELLAQGAELPPPVVLGTEGRVAPQVRVISEDELPVDLRNPEQVASNEFEPDEEGIDFYESLEGMRVLVPDPVVVGPSERFGVEEGGVWVLSDGGAHVTPEDARTFRGGILLQPDPENRGDQNPERIRLRYDPVLTRAAVPSLATGAELGDALGVMGYGHGNYRVAMIRAPRASESPPPPESTTLDGTKDGLTIATYNVLNLNPLPEAEARMRRLGEHVASRLGAPAVVALQEIQDANGTRGGADDPETDATATLRALTDAIEAAGGPRYEAFDVAPAPNASGGVPGGNIRNAFLFDPSRVDLVGYRSLTPGVLREIGARDPEAFEGSRNPLSARFLFGGDTITVIDNHLTSRYGSTPIFGAIHPFVQAGEEARAAQARALHDVVAAALERDADAAVVVLGDFNTFEWTDDLDRLLASTGEEDILHDLVLEVPPGERYSYVFEGNSQELDHLFVTGALREGAALDVVHVNADVPEDAPNRASDHEPLVARLRVR